MPEHDALWWTIRHWKCGRVITIEVGRANPIARRIAIESSGPPRCPECGHYLAGGDGQVLADVISSGHTVVSHG